MDAFEKWCAEYGIAHPMYDRPNYRERFYASEAFRAGMRAAAEIVSGRLKVFGADDEYVESHLQFVRDAILAEADK